MTYCLWHVLQVVETVDGRSPGKDDDDLDGSSFVLIEFNAKLSACMSSTSSRRTSLEGASTIALSRACSRAASLEVEGSPREAIATYSRCSSEAFDQSQARDLHS